MDGLAEVQRSILNEINANIDMAASTQTPEQRELSLVGKVEMRIALADSDNKLESTLKTYRTGSRILETGHASNELHCRMSRAAALLEVCASYSKFG